MKNPFYKLSFTSGTTTFSECRKAIRYINSHEDFLQEYHAKISQLYDGAAVYSFCAARMALYSFLVSQGIGNGDEIILQGYTCVVVAQAILYAGAIPIYVDINEDDYNINLDDLLLKINPKTKAIIVQHTYGNPCEDIFKIKAICKESGIILIEDCAHIIGGEFSNSEKIGTVGDVSIISTDHTKYISTSIGGLIIINNSNFIANFEKEYINCEHLKKSTIIKIVLQLLITNLLLNKHIYKIGSFIARIYSSRKLNLTFYMSDYSSMEKSRKYPYPARFPNILALVGIQQINNLMENIKHREKISNIYKQHLSDYIRNDKISNAPLRFPIKLINKCAYIEKLEKIVRAEDWFNCPLQCIKKSELGKFHYEIGMCPNAEKITGTIINLPVHLKITENDAYDIVNAIKQLGIQ